MSGMHLTLTLVMTTFFFSCYGIYKYKNFINPLVIFNGIWFSCFFAYFLDLSNFGNSLAIDTFIIFLMMILCYNIIFYIIDKFYVNLPVSRKINKKLIDKIFLFIIVVNIIEVIFSGGIPLVWMFTKSSKTYVDFGIPTVHGFVNSLSWVVITYYVIDLINTKFKNKKDMLKVLYIIMFFVFCLARQALITIFIQIFIVLLVKRAVKMRYLLLLGFTVLISFGLLGNIRTSYDSFLIRSNFQILVPSIFSFIVWIYMYIASPISNFNSIVVAGLASSSGYIMLNNILPSILHNIVKLPAGSIPIDIFINPLYNVSTFLSFAYVDFGLIGTFIITLLYSFLISFSWKLFRLSSDSDLWLLFYATSAGIVALSFFTNMLVLLPFLFQFFILFILYIFGSTKNG